MFLTVIKYIIILTCSTYFVDGVGEGQLSYVYKTELEQIKVFYCTLTLLIHTSKISLLWSDLYSIYNSVKIMLKYEHIRQQWKTFIEKVESRCPC